MQARTNQQRRLRATKRYTVAGRRRASESRSFVKVARDLGFEDRRDAAGAAARAASGGRLAASFLPRLTQGFRCCTGTLQWQTFAPPYDVKTAPLYRPTLPPPSSGQYSQGPGTQRKTSPATATWQTDGNDR